jgi:HK97 family phage major capsid protein
MLEFDSDDMVTELRKTREVFDKHGTKLDRRVDGLEESINDIYRRVQRPGADGGYEPGVERKDAILMCQDRHSWLHQKQDGQRVDYTPSSREIEDAIAAQRAMRNLIWTGDFRRLSAEDQKSLSAFSFGNSDWMLAPAVSSRVLSCLTDRSDFLSLFLQETISSGSIIYPVDNSEFEGAGWSCEFSCDGPGASLAPIGQLEIKAESLRARICATPDILQDASYNLEGWLIQKASRAFRHQIAQAVMTGDGNDKPLGLLSSQSGIPICDSSAATTPGEFSCQDLVSLKYQVPEEFFTNGTYMMNQRTLALCLTMTDGAGRPYGCSFRRVTPVCRVAL